MAVTSDFCPTADQEMAQLVQLLPRGKAWETLIGGVRYGFFAALRDILLAFDAMCCTLLREFFCATTTLLESAWMAEYGLPDACDPYPDLCAKVAAIGGATCADYEAIAAGIGWSIACLGPCTSPAGSIQAGMAVGNPPGPGVIELLVSISNSPAAGPQLIPANAGCYAAGAPNDCGYDLTPLDCVLQRVVQAHAEIIYVIGA